MPKRTIEIAGRPITLDARPDRLDLRDLPYRPSVVCLAPIYPGEKIFRSYYRNIWQPVWFSTKNQKAPAPDSV